MQGKQEICFVFRLLSVVLVLWNGNLRFNPHSFYIAQTDGLLSLVAFRNPHTQRFLFIERLQLTTEALLAQLLVTMRLIEAWNTGGAVGFGTTLGRPLILSLN